MKLLVKKKIINWIKKIIKTKNPLSVLLFGPPGSGKTTIAKLYAKSFSRPFKILSAVFSSVSDIKKIINEVKQNPLFNIPTILFVDEIHRFNKAQQDSFLPFMEDGTIILIGATTENPSFALNNSLISRLRVFSLDSLSINELKQIIKNYEKKFNPLNLTEEVQDFILQTSCGDARHLLNMVENIQNLEENKRNLEEIKDFLQKKPALYDKNRDNHYNLISALHKSVRGSDSEAALYWLARMLEGGEDPLYITRRLIIIALEDIGLADPDALKITLMSDETYRKLGFPEGEIALAQAVIYLALAPKSNKVYLAYEKSKVLAKSSSHLSPPMHILNAPTQLMKDLGYSKGYVYDHDVDDCFSNQNYFPQELSKTAFYEPKNIGFEKELIKRIAYFERLRKKKS